MQLTELRSQAAASRQAGAVRSVARRPVLCQAGAEQQSRRQLIGGLVGLGLALSGSSAKADPFLSSTGARGVLRDEEEKLYRLRVEKESEARQQLQAERQAFEEEAKRSQDGKLCATPFGVDVVGITEAIALVGALVGGVTARRRKEEVERLNEQLRAINLSLRQQARAGTVYAPGLSYAPTTAPLPPAPRGGVAAVPPVIPTRDSNGAGPAAAPAVAAAAAVVVAPPPKPTPAPAAPAAAPQSNSLNTLFSMEEDELSGDQIQCKEALRAGKRLLKEKNGAAAMVRFEKALMLSKALADKVQERRAQRGLAASCRLTHQYRQAIKHLERVLEISREIKEFTGDADAYGTMADCYTDMGEFEKAALYYDKYIAQMNREGPI
ncbi:hypothetical protein HYH03_013656 [Edaphochlamys debaryana]|uniref:Uncharacterized protein n=1 Tax=Edaphochlamys debaryana TaxID=47281 RepID=A0A836BT73_9CHLO|nr:hypothetical protein HYH03_013656 [Edaphochlamys debaryana]|eukprot:KAG2487812.1 hypothetical protein HYH03_013656 [Edaphochlamys debaryana]